MKKLYSFLISLFAWIPELFRREKKSFSHHAGERSLTKGKNDRLIIFFRKPQLVGKVFFLRVKNKIKVARISARLESGRYELSF